jgi:hypothetical protein
MANGRKTVEDIEKENDALRRQSELIQERAKAARQEVEAIRAKVEAKKELVKIGIELKDAETDPTKKAADAAALRDELRAHQTLKDELRDSTKAHDDLSDALERNTKARQKNNDKIQKAEAQVKAGALIYESQLDSILGLSGGLKTFSQALNGGSNGLNGYAAAALKSIKSGELLRGVTLKLVEVNLQFALEQDKVISNFRSQTGAGDEFNNVIRDTERATFAAGVSLEDAAEAVRELKNTFTDFTYLNRSQQQAVTETTALLNEMGFSFSTQSQIMQTATQAMGMSVQESQQLLTDLASTARSLGVDVNTLGAAFESNKDFIVRFGEDGQEVFEEMAVASKALGIEIGTLIGVVEKFKKFDLAGQAVGRLNAILGGPFLNSIDMLNASYEDPIEGIKMLREGFEQAGVAVEDLSGAELEAFASAIGLSTTETKKLLGASNEELEIQRLKQEELAEQAAATQAIQEKLNNAMKAFYINMGPVVDLLVPLIDNLGAAAQAMGNFLNSKAGLTAFGAVMGATLGGGIGLMMGLADAGLAATAGIPVVGPALAGVQAGMVANFKRSALASLGIGALAGGIVGGLGGFGLSSLGAGSPGPQSAAAGNTTNYAGEYANGGTVTALVGERGPEFVEMPTGSQVTTAPKTEKLTKTIEMLVNKLDKMGSGTQQIAVYIGQEKIDEIVVKGLNSEKARSAFSPYTNA